MPKSEKKPPAKKKTRPLRWLRDATPEEIGEALFTVGPDKAAQVVHYLIQRMGPELGRQLERLESEMRSDPMSSLAKFAFGGLNALRKGR